jgi:hypothetical protein
MVLHQRESSLFVIREQWKKAVWCLLERLSWRLLAGGWLVFALIHGFQWLAGDPLAETVVFLGTLWTKDFQLASF